MKKSKATFIFLLASNILLAQQAKQKSYPIVFEQYNVIQQSQSLKNFMYKISNPREKLTTIKIFHIGDSHIKTGAFSQKLMEMLNEKFNSKMKDSVRIKTSFFKYFFNISVFAKNGTKYADYSDLKELEQSLAVNQPDLIIISLGANDAFAGDFKENFLQKIQSLFNTIKKNTPTSDILITTPPESMKQIQRNKFLPNENIKKVKDSITLYCRKNNVAAWDLYTILGGIGSMKRWSAAGFVQADYVHYTNSGYEYFATLLSAAIRKMF